MGNLLDLQFNNRLIVPNDVTIALNKNKSESGLKFRNKINVAVEEHDKNLMRKDDNYTAEQQSIVTYLQNLAKHSFNIELSLYEKINENYATAIKEAFKLQSNYLTTTYENTTLGQALTNLFYSGGTSEKKLGLTQLLQDLGQLDTNKLIENMNISNTRMVANIIANSIDSFMRNSKIEKNIAAGISNEALQVFSEIYNEQNIMDVVSGKKISDKKVKKVIRDALSQLQNSEDFSSSFRAEQKNKMLGVIQAGKTQLEEAISFLINELVDQIYITISPYIQENVSEKKIRDAIIELLKSGKKNKGDNEKLGFTFTAAGAARKKRTSQDKNNQNISFSLASYRLDIDKIEKDFAGFVIQRENTEEKNINIEEIVEESIDESVKKALQDYNEILQIYLKTLGHEEAWKYYKRHFLAEVVKLAIRDFSDEKKNNESISNINDEIKKGINALQKAHSINIVIKQLESLKEGLGDKNNSNINNMIKNLLSKDKKDQEVLKQAQELINKGNAEEEAIKIIRDRLVSKKAGFISNFNGTIGEIFISAIISVVFQNKEIKGQVYQKGSSTNLKGQSAHADIVLDLQDTKIGLQSKIYKQDNIKLYEDTEVTFKTSNALRYLRTRNLDSIGNENDELTSFRFFLLNNSILKEIGNSSNGEEKLSKNDDYFLQALNLRLENFIKYSDGLTSLGEIKNNFYLINFHIVPASVIFLKMAELFENPNTINDLIIFNNQVNTEEVEKYEGNDSNDYLLNNTNVLKLLNDTSAKFKSFTLNLSDLGVDKY